MPIFVSIKPAYWWCAFKKYLLLLMPLTLERPPVAQTLKHQTEAAHMELEAMVLPWLQSISSNTDYVQLLKGFYGYFKPLEDAVAPYITEAVLPDWEQRRKAYSILQDLAQLPGAYSELPLATHLPSIQSLPQALGAMYVMEGSTLGGKGIAKMLVKNKSVNLKGEQLQFFTGYGARTGTMWTTFVNVLNSFSGTDAEVARMVASANQTFSLFKSWLQEVRTND